MTEKYLLSCPVCGKKFPDTYLLACPNGCPGLLRADYSRKKLTLRDLPGMFRFSDWLPVNGHLKTRSAPICYKSSGLAEKLGLHNLYIGFSGYSPDRGAFVTSGSFKEFEALPTVVRLRERTDGKGIIQVSSAGNTGRAFAQISAETGEPVIIVVPEKAKNRIWTSSPAENILLITVPGDYTDAIHTGNTICTIPGIYPEGGAKNVARRDGMGTVMLEGALMIGTMPRWYVQAVGSGTGGIAAWEASLRLRQDGRFGTALPRLLLVQNDPFTPMVRAWNEHRRDIQDADMPEAKESISRVFSDVLTNRAPPYGLPGGVFDALQDTGGLFVSASSSDAMAASDLVKKYEGYDPDPAAAVCVAGFIRAVQEGIIKSDDPILLNITGGGYDRIASDLKRYVKEPDIMMDDMDANAILPRVREWMNRYV